MPEVQADPCLRDRTGVLVDDFCDFCELSTKMSNYESKLLDWLIEMIWKINKSRNHLPFTCLDVFEIECTFFEMREPQLCWRRSIAVRCTENHLKTQMVDTRPRFGATMVCSTIHQHNNAVSPASFELTGKDLRKSRQEHHHDVLICVTLRQR